LIESTMKLNCVLLIRLIFILSISSAVVGCSSDGGVNSEDDGGFPAPATSRIAGFFKSSDADEVSGMYINVMAGGSALRYTLSDTLNCFITQQFRVSWTGNDSDIYLVSVVDSSGIGEGTLQTIVRDESGLQITYRDSDRTVTESWFTVVAHSLEDLSLCD